MPEIREYIWAFPVVAGVIAIASLLIPAASMNLMGMMTATLWYWDLYTYNFGGGVLVGTEFIMEPMVLTFSMITTGIFAVSGIYLLLSGIKARKTDMELRKMVNPLVAFGVLLLISTILWLILVPMFFPIEDFLGPPPPGYTYDFWSMSYMGMKISLHTINFGVIGGFLGGAVAIGGGAVANYYSKERDMKIPEKKEIKPPVEKAAPSEKAKFEFCPECGAKIEDSETKFCGKCGFEFKPTENSPP
jgi:hypothetical protein